MAPDGKAQIKTNFWEAVQKGSALAVASARGVREFLAAFTALQRPMLRKNLESLPVKWAGIQTTLACRTEPPTISKRSSRFARMKPRSHSRSIEIGFETHICYYNEIVIRISGPTTEAVEVRSLTKLGVKMSQAIASRSEARVRDQASVRLKISSTGVASAKVADVLRTPQAQKQLAAVSLIREASTARAKK